MNRDEMENIISRKAIGTGEINGMSRKEFNQYLIKHYGSEIKAVLKEFWDKQYLRVDGFKEVTLTGRYADYRNSKNYGQTNANQRTEEATP
jgi:hypothetical protein